MNPKWLAYLLSISSFLLAHVVTSVAQTPKQTDQATQKLWQIAVMQCDATHHQALIRFGLSNAWENDNENVTDGAYAPIPAPLGTAWAKFPRYLRGQCKLSDGQTLSLAYDGVPTGRGSDWGEGTMNVALTINGHLAYDELPVQHSILGSAASRDPYDIDAILYDGTNLWEFDPADQSGTTRIDVSQRLRPNYVYTNPVELAFWKKQQAQKRLSENLSAFCKSFDFSQAPRGWGRSWKLLKPDLQSQLSIFGDENSPLGVTEASFDINNSGKPSPVFSINFGADDNPGNSVLVAFTKNPSLADIFRAGIQNHTLISEPDVIIPPAIAAGSIQIGHQMTFSDFAKPTAYDTAFENAPLQLNGVTYIYSYSDGFFVEPASLILKLNPDDSITKVCQFP